ncbi:MAG: flavodoxin family protein [Fibrobacterota bacterium]
MKIMGICGSPKRQGSTTLFALKKALEAVRENGVDTDVIHLGDYSFGGCIDCGACWDMDEPGCSQDDDFTDHIVSALNDRDIAGFIFASPVYFGGMTSQMKAFFDRAVSFRRKGFRWENRVAGALSVGRSRHGGQELTEMDILRSALVQGMVAVPDSSPTSHFGANLWSGNPEGIENDAAGLKTAVNLGRKVAEIAQKVHG